MFYHLLVHSSQLKMKTQVNQDNCLIHKTDGFCIHHWNHSHLHPLYKVHQLCKNPQLQLLHHNSNLCGHQIQMKLDNCLSHKTDGFRIHHWNHSHLHSLHMVHCLCKNPDLQSLQHNSNLCVYQIQVKLGNCLIHI